MGNAYSYKNLLGMPNLCGGGPLAALVFCCNPAVKKCPIRDYALAQLGITRDDFIAVKEKHRVEAEETCFGNLAYCCSLEKKCPHRDAAIKRLGWTPADYLRYKFRILRDLIPPEKMQKAFTERVIMQYAIEAMELDTKKVYRAMAFGNLRMRLIMLTELIENGTVKDETIEEFLKKNDTFIAVRVPSVFADGLDKLVSEGLFRSRSDALRAAILLLLKTYNAIP